MNSCIYSRYIDQIKCVCPLTKQNEDQTPLSATRSAGVASTYPTTGVPATLPVPSKKTRTRLLLNPGATLVPDGSTSIATSGLSVPICVTACAAGQPVTSGQDVLVVLILVVDFASASDLRNESAKQCSAISI
jgi:hypothetical protein